MLSWAVATRHCALSGRVLIWQQTDYGAGVQGNKHQATFCVRVEKHISEAPHSLNKLHQS